MATTVANVTFTDVQWLADRPRGEGMVVSCYADTSASSGVRSLWRTHLDSEVKRVEETLGDTAARRWFRRNVAEIRAVLSSSGTRAARGMAVFAAVQYDLVHAYALTVSVANRLVVDEEPYLMPLVELLNRQHRYFVVHTDTHRGRLYSAVPGAVRLIEEINESVPKRHRAAGELWGKQQATIERHRKDHILHYFKELVREMERAWPEEAYDGIVLLGEHEVLEQVRAHLPDHLACRIVGESPHAWVGKQTPLEAKIEAIRTKSLEERDRRLLEDVKRRLLERHQIAAGPQAVIDALRNSQIGFPGRVVMEPDRGDVARRCTGCKSLFADAVDECPFCQARCEKTNLWQAIALLAARHNVPVDSVAAGFGLEKHGGVAALLAREHPWAAPESTLTASFPEQRA